MSKEITITISAPEHLLNGIASEVIKIINGDGPNNLVTIKNKDSKTYFTVKEAADQLKVEPQTIRKHINSGLLKASKPGKSWRITQKNLDNYVQNI